MEEQDISYDQFWRLLYQGYFNDKEDQAYELLEGFSGVAHYPLEVKGAMRYEAYDKGHASGVSEIINVYQDILALCKKVYDAGYKQGKQER